MEKNNLEYRIVEILKRKQYTITTAESCSGGLLAARIIGVDGASSVFQEGYITYSDKAKESLLSVSHSTLEKFGAVSGETAAQMAKGAARKAKSHVALSITGIAGPTGGTKDKPVGLVYIGCCVNENITVKKCLFQGDRGKNRQDAVEEALVLLEQILIQ